MKLLFVLIFAQVSSLRSSWSFQYEFSENSSRFQGVTNEVQRSANEVDEWDFEWYQGED